MIIDKLTASDIKAAQAFMLQVIKEDFGYDFNPEWHEDIVDLEKKYLASPRACFYIAKDSGRIVGTIAARPYDKNYPELEGRYTSDTTLSIWRHYISKPMRGQGIGSRLLQEVERFGSEHGYTLLYLHTQKTIPGSLEYWLAKGFSKTVEKDDEFRTVHMEKSIGVA